MTVKNASILVLLSSIWGFSFIFIRVAVVAVGPFFLMEMRVLIASITLLLFALATKNKVNFLLNWKKYVVLGTLNAAIPFVLISVAELHITSSLAAILNATAPLFTALVSIAWMKEEMEWSTFLGVIIGLLGVTILVGWSPIELNQTVFWAIVASLVAALFYGIGGVYSKLYFNKESPFEVAVGQQIGASIVLLPFALYHFPIELPSSSVILSILGLAIFCTALAYIFYFYLMQNIGPTKTVGVTFLVPVFGISWGWFFLNEEITISLFFGLVIIITSVLLINYTKKQDTVVVGQHGEQ